MEPSVSQPQTALFGAGGKFDIAEAMPIFERAARVAAAMFGAARGDVLIVRRNGAWWVGDEDRREALTDALRNATDHPIWVEAAGAGSRLENQVLIQDAPELRFLASAPIPADFGPPIGALCVMDAEPRPRDPGLAERLADLAAMAGAEYDALVRARTSGSAAVNAQPETADASLGAFVEAAPSPVYMTDRDLRVLHFSPSWRESMQLCDTPVTGRRIDEIFEGAAAYRGVYDHCLTGATLLAERIALPLPDGAALWVDAEIVPWRDGNGEVGGLVVSTFPVNAMVKALDDIERSKERLELAAKLAQMHVWELDYRRGAFETSGAASHIFDAPDFNALTANPLDHVHPDDRARVWEHWMADSARGYGTPVEYRTIRTDGVEIWVSGITEMMFENGVPVRHVGAMQDITARKLAELEMKTAREAAEEANKAKSQFLAIMSHEIRTPLNGVLGMTQAMVADDLSDVQRDRLEIIKQSGETLLAILNDILDISKIEAGKLELEEAEFNLSDLALGAHAAFTAIANRKGLSFNLIVADAARGLYRGDSTRIRQILYNLISNALKFTEEGHVRVDVDRNLSGLFITVADTGVGIPESAQAVLFQKFVQADATTTRRFGGTGLGLAICRELAGLMGGDITVESRLGQGATFRVHLPIPRLAEEPAPLPCPSTANATPEGGHAVAGELRILAAEDNTVNQLVLRTLLHQIGLDPVIVGDGQAALAAWEADRWDVILMDVQMPVMDGPTAARAIRALEAETGRARTPIIALTANAMSHQVSEYLACGMDGVVPKPLEITRLFATLQQVLEPADEAA